MTLADALAAQAATAADRIPADSRAVLNRSIEVVAEAQTVDGAKTVGDIAPDFNLADHNGNATSLSRLLERGPVVVTFYRGGWCPYCNLQLRALQAVLPEMESLGAMLVAISPQAPDNSLHTAEKAELSFPVLSDPDAAVGRAYGLVFTLDADAQQLYTKMGNDLTRINGTDTWELPIPATYVIGTDGNIRFAVADPDYRKRAEPTDVLEALRRLQPPSGPPE